MLFSAFILCSVAFSTCFFFSFELVLCFTAFYSKLMSAKSFAKNADLEMDFHPVLSGYLQSPSSFSSQPLQPLLPQQHPERRQDAAGDLKGVEQRL